MIAVTPGGHDSDPAASAPLGDIGQSLGPTGKFIGGYGELHAGGGLIRRG